MLRKRIITWIVSGLLLAVLAFIIVKILDAKGLLYESSQQTFSPVRVEKGEIKKYVKIDDASLAAKESVNLAFETAGTLEKIFIGEGKNASQGDAVAKIETKELELQKKQLEAGLTQSKANLNKLLAGATPEDLKIFETRKLSAKKSATASKRGMVDVLRGGYTAADDAVRGKTNQLFTNPDSSNPQLLFSVDDAGLEAEIELQRSRLNEDLDSFQNRVGELDTSSDFDDEVDYAKGILGDTQDYLDNVSRAVNALVAEGGLSQETIDAWKASVSAGRTAVDTAKVNISEAYEALRSSSGTYSVTKSEFDYKEASARSDDITVMDARVEEVKNQLGIIEEKLRKAVIVAPYAGKVTKIWFKEKEVVGAGQTVVSFDTFEQKVQADIPEEDIGDIHLNNAAIIKFKSFPEMKISGKIDSIESHEIIKDGDVYYRVFVKLSEFNPELRSGMTADLSIDSEKSEIAVKIPKKYVEERGGRSFVRVMDGKKQKEVEVETGDADDNFIEITGGLSEGQVLVEPELQQ